MFLSLVSGLKELLKALLRGMRFDFRLEGGPWFPDWPWEVACTRLMKVDYYLL